MRIIASVLTVLTLTGCLLTIPVEMAGRGLIVLHEIAVSLDDDRPNQTTEQETEWKPSGKN